MNYLVRIELDALPQRHDGGRGFEAVGGLSFFSSWSSRSMVGGFKRKGQEARDNGIDTNNDWVSLVWDGLVVFCFQRRLGTGLEGVSSIQ